MQIENHEFLKLKNKRKEKILLPNFDLGKGYGRSWSQMESLNSKT